MAGSLQAAPGADTPLVNLSEIAEIELFILKRMKEFTLGDHASVFKGAGFNFVGTRDWQPGDRPSSIDWAQSSINNFSPLITRDFEQDSNATIVAVADAAAKRPFFTRDERVAMVREVVDRHYVDVTRYTTSGFLRAKLGPALAARGVAPHIFETAEEAQRALARAASG